MLAVQANAFCGSLLVLFSAAATLWLLRDGEETGASMNTSELENQSMKLYIDRARLWLALRAFFWARRTIRRIHEKRGRDFIGSECDVIDRHRIVYTELDQLEDRRRVASFRL